MRALTIFLSSRYNWNQMSDLLWTKAVKEVLAIRRKFVNIKLESLTHKESDILKVVKAHRFSLKLMEISFGYFRCHSFMEILSSMENLETLNIRNSSLQTTDVVTVVPLKRLKHVKLNGCSWKILQLLSASSIVSLEVQHTCGNNDHFKKFLSTQSTLETLKIEGFSLGIAKLFKDDLSSDSAMFQLKKFKFGGSNSKEIITAEAESNFIKFLKTHGKYLQEIEVNGQVSPRILTFIITQLTTLEKLLLDVQYIPSEKHFYTYLRPSKSIKALTLVEKFKDDASAKGILGIFSQVESLSVSSINEVVMKLVATNYQKLKCLRMKKMPFTHFPLHLKFPSLKEFHVDDIRSISNWCAFLKDNPTIEKLTVKEIYLQMITVTSVQVIINCTNIKHIQLRGGLKAMKEFLGIINEIGHNQLETMELIVNNMNESFTRPFFFALPKDKTPGTLPLQCPYLDDFIWTREF